MGKNNYLGAKRLNVGNGTSELHTAFGLTLFTGLSTGIGRTTAFPRKTNTKFLSLALGFSAGVMIYASFVEILRKANDGLVTVLGLHGGWWVTVGSFFGGIFLIALIDKLIPEVENPHVMHRVEELGN